MNDTNHMQRLEERVLRMEARERSRVRVAKALVAVLAVGSLVAGVQEARAWGGCTQFLSGYGLKTFCAGDPALASDINGNFQVLAKALEAKTGAIASPNITAAETITANKGIAVSGLIAGGVYSPGAIDYNTAKYTLPVVDGAAIVNDSKDYKSLLILGNNSGGPNRSVLVYENLGVPNGNLNVGGNAVINGSSTIYGNSTVVGTSNVNGNSTVYANSTVYGSESIQKDLNVPNNQWQGVGPVEQDEVLVSDNGVFQTGDCPNGQYVCGLTLSHGPNWNQNKFRLRCCLL